MIHVTEDNYDEINSELQELFARMKEEETEAAMPLIFIGSGCDAETCFLKSQQHL